MAQASITPYAANLPDHSSPEIGRKWGWTLTIGILLIIFGLFMISRAAFATFASMLVLGWTMVAAAFVHVVGTFRAASWKHALVQLLIAALYLIAGALVLRRPEATAIGLTLLISAFLLASGLVRIVMSVALQMRSWGWVLANGVVTALLGILVMNQWPTSGFWVIGLFVGVDLLFHGAALCAFAYTLKEIRDIGITRPTHHAPAPTY